MNWLMMTPQGHDRLTGLLLASLIHGALFFGGSRVFYTPPQYGINAHMGSVEVNLVAALPAEVQQKPEKVEKETNEQKPKSSTTHGDGSSPVPGHDAVTFHSVGAIQTVVSPDFVENMAPPYPERAKEQKQEGLVILLARVDGSGRPVEVNIKQSSGYFLLDEAGLKAVKGWKFKPARRGGLAVESKTEVPIRFRLDQ